MVRIRDVIITEEREEHIWIGHRVTPDEVEEVCFNDPLDLRGRDGSYEVYGQAEGGRYLSVFLFPRGRGVFALATARDATESERRRYQQVKRR
ncbi:MAG: BrnT family toxin [Dehalococcoidia bacterium]